METIRTATVDLGKTVRFIFTGPNHHQRAEMARNFVADALKGELWLGAGVLCTDLTAGKSAFILRSSAGPASSSRPVLRSTPRPSSTSR